MKVGGKQLALFAGASVGLRVIIPGVAKGILRALSLYPPVGHVAPETTDKADGMFVNLSFGKTHCRYSIPGGKSRGVVVLVHGYTTAALCYDQLAEAVLKAGYSVVTYDLYGRGHSDAPDVHHTGDLFVSQLSDLLGALHINEPVTVVGLSMGGGIVTEFADRFPTRVKGFVLISPACPHFPVSALGKYLGVQPGVGEFMFYALGSSMLGNYRNTINVDAAGESEVKKMEDAFGHQVRNHRGFFRSQYRSLRDFPENREEVMRRVGEHDRPVLLLWGTDDPLTPFSESAEVLRLMPRCKLVELSGCRHWALLEARNTVHSSIVEYLDKLQ